VGEAGGGVAGLGAVVAVKIRFDVTASDWEALTDFQVAHSTTLSRTIQRTQLAAAGVALLLAAVFWSLMQSLFVTIVSLAAGAWATYDAPRYIRRSMHKQMRAMFDETFPAGSNTENLLEARADGLFCESVRGTATLAWTAITAVSESNTHLFLGIGAASGLIVPKQRLREGSVAEFANAVRQQSAGTPR